MSLQFVVANNFVRAFLHIVTGASKIGEVVYFVAHKDGLEISAVNASHSTHFMASSHRSNFQQFSYVRPTHSNRNNNNSEEGEEEGEAGANKPAGGELYLSFLSRALQATILRQSVNLKEIDSICVVHHDERATAATTTDDHNHNMENEADDDGGPDKTRWQFLYHNGTIKTYHLRLTEDVPLRVQTSPDLYHFELCGDAKRMGGLFTSLPSTAQRCVVYPLEARLELCCMEQGGLSSDLDHPAAGARTGSGRPSAVLQAQQDASQVVISSYPHNFFFFRYYNGEDADAVGMGSNASSSGGGSGGRPSFLPLPGKAVDVKPLKTAALLAGQLGLHLVVRSGGDGAPLVLQSLTDTEVRQQQQQLELEDPRQPHEQPYGSRGNNSSFLPHAMDSALRVQFCLHVAAMDFPHPGPPAALDVPPPSRRHTTHSRVSDGVSSTRVSASEPVMGGPRDSVSSFAAPTAESSVCPPTVTPLSAPPQPPLRPSGAKEMNLRTSTAGTGMGHCEEAAVVARSTASHVSSSAVPYTPSQVPGSRGDTPLALFSGVKRSREGEPPSADLSAVGPSYNEAPVAAERPSLTEMFPLDFAAFVGEGAAEEDADEDEELRQFLESCSANMRAHPQSDDDASSFQ